MMRAAWILVALAIASHPALAQDRRTLSVSRALIDSVPHTVKVEFAVGKIQLQPAASPLLYSMQLDYDEGRSDAVHSYDRAEHTLNIGMPNQDIHLSNKSERGEQRGTMQLALTRAVPLNLSLEIGAAEADLAFGGLALSALKIEGGASSARVAFDSLNPISMRTLELDLGAAGLRARSLANANAAAIKLDGAVGDADLDFSGQWTHDVEISADMIFGRLRFRVPADVGVRVEVDRLLASLHLDGFTKSGNAWVSDNFASAPHKLRIRADVMFGTIRVERLAR